MWGRLAAIKDRAPNCFSMAPLLPGGGDRPLSCSADLPSPAHAASEALTQQLLRSRQQSLHTGVIKRSI